MTSLSLITKDEYLKDLIYQIKNLDSNQEVYLMTMTFDHAGEQIKLLIETLNNALARNIEVTLLIDAQIYIFRNFKYLLGPLFYSSSLKKTYLSGRWYKELNNILDNLESNGAKLKIINKPNRLFSSPFKGRSHIKISLIGEILYIGGANLVDDNHHDYMVKLENLKSISKLRDLVIDIHKKERVSESILEDIQLLTFKDTKIMVDRGLPLSSRILSTAIQLIEASKEEIIFTCQFFPDRTILHPLYQAAKRGIKVKIVFNHHSKHFFPLSLVQYLMFVTRLGRRLSNLQYIRNDPRDRFLHAKILLVDNNLLIGSHNLVGAGVKYGTAEIALIDNNTVLSSKLKNIFKPW